MSVGLAMGITKSAAKGLIQRALFRIERAIASEPVATVERPRRRPAHAPTSASVEDATCGVQLFAE